MPRPRIPLPALSGTALAELRVRMDVMRGQPRLMRALLQLQAAWRGAFVRHLIRSGRHPLVTREDLQRARERHRLWLQGLRHHSRSPRPASTTTPTAPTPSTTSAAQSKAYGLLSAATVQRLSPQADDRHPLQVPVGGDFTQARHVFKENLLKQKQKQKLASHQSPYKVSSRKYSSEQPPSVASAEQDGEHREGSVSVVRSKNVIQTSVAGIPAVVVKLGPSSKTYQRTDDSPPRAATFPMRRADAGKPGRKSRAPGPRAGPSRTPIRSRTTTPTLPESFPWSPTLGRREGPLSLSAPELLPPAPSSPFASAASLLRMPRSRGSAGTGGTPTAVEGLLRDSAELS
eukprot:RCo004149